MVVCCDVADSNATLCCTSSPLSWPSHGWFSWPALSWVSCMRRRNVWKRYSCILVNNQFITHCGWLCLTHSVGCVYQAMKIMGMKRGVNWLAWFLNTLVGMLIMSVIVVVFVCVGRIFPLSHPVIIFLFLAAFSLSVTMFRCVLDSTWCFTLNSYITTLL